MEELVKFTLSARRRSNYPVERHSRRKSVAATWALTAMTNGVRMVVQLARLSANGAPWWIPVFEAPVVPPLRPDCVLQPMSLAIPGRLDPPPAMLHQSQRPPWSHHCTVNAATSQLDAQQLTAAEQTMRQQKHSIARRQ